MSVQKVKDLGGIGVKLYVIVKGEVVTTEATGFGNGRVMSDCGWLYNRTLGYIWFFTEEEAVAKMWNKQRNNRKSEKVEKMSRKDRESYDMQGLRSLAVAVTEKAWKDYRIYLKRDRREYEYKMQVIENYFRSSPLVAVLDVDGDKILEKIRDDVYGGKYCG